MDYRLICQWLGLPPCSWPPDHYTLLGLPRGEGDPARIERNAQERMQRLRVYQLSHPEQTTEAMNRLAQALVCLTDRAAKVRYDASLEQTANGPAPAVPAAAEYNGPPAAIPPLAALLQQPAHVPALPSASDWATAPPPVRVAVPEEVPTPAAPEPPVVTPTDVSEQAPPATPVLPAPSVVPAPPLDPVLEAARHSPAARRGLGTRRALLERLLAARELLFAWEQAGKYVSRPRRRLSRLAEGTDLTRKLVKIDQLLLDFPPLLGQAGQPGYRVVMLAREENVAGAFQGLEPDERETLALDWNVGRDVLTAHMDYVREQVRLLRRQPWWRRLFRPVRAFVNDHPGWIVLLVLLALGLMALSVFQFL